MTQNINKDLNIFLEFLGEITPLVFKNNLRIILGSKSEKLKNVETQKKLSILIKKECRTLPGTRLAIDHRTRIRLFRDKTNICDVAMPICKTNDFLC